MIHTKWSYSVAVSTSDFESDISGSNPDRTFYTISNTECMIINIKVIYYHMINETPYQVFIRFTFRIY